MNDCSDAYTPRDTRNLRIFNVWAISAAVMFVAATILISRGIVARGPLAWILAIANLLLTLLAVRAYMVFLRAADELLRRIQLEGLALGFGAGAVFMLSYRLFERLGALKLDSADPFVVMAIFWAIGQYIGLRRYAPGMER
ncbi:MAG: hypothetical protein AABO58_14145 [Acidobacteriota bacterium]